MAITLAEPREQRLLGNIERLTKQQISLETVPTVADLRARRIGQTVAALREVLDDNDELYDYREIVDELSADHSIERIAMAAAKLAHDADGAADEEDVEIPDARRFSGADRGSKGPKQGRKGQKGRPTDGSLADRGRDNDEPTGFLYVAMGRHAGMRPGDLVGAIANEVGLEGRQIGPIRIADKYSVVGVPERAVEHAIEVLNGSTIRGKPTKVRRYTE